MKKKQASNQVRLSHLMRKSTNLSSWHARPNYTQHLIINGAATFV